ncbi:MAG: BON domain-containing protein [Burkholderiales bacterium]|nr:BON domain-containing protein [Burkholderiales bacterium]
MRLGRWVWMAMGLALPAIAAAQERQNYFNDPLLQVTSAVAGCPAPRPPAMTPEELRAAAHVRAQHGGSCYRAGRCRLPDSYLYDREIIPRVQLYLRQDGRFDNTTVWALGERRLVTLMGCVQSQEQALAMEHAVLLVDDVMGVINYLMVGTAGAPQYTTTDTTTDKPTKAP